MVPKGLWVALAALGISTAWAGGNTVSSSSLVFAASSAQTWIRESLDGLITAFESRNLRDFMQRVSGEYASDRDNLEDLVRRRMGTGAEFSIRYSINNVTFDGLDKAFVSLTFQRFERDLETGKPISVRGSSSMVFRLENGAFVLYDMREPFVF